MLNDMPLRYNKKKKITKDKKINKKRNMIKQIKTFHLAYNKLRGASSYMSPEDQQHLTSNSSNMQ